MARKWVDAKYNCEDLKDPQGLWLRSYTTDIDGTRTNCITRAGQVWSKINVRCKPNGEVQNRANTYVGCENGFQNFQVFAEWATAEPNYLTREGNDKYWQLDKDILVKGNKAYSEQTCCFVPTWLNTTFSTRQKGDSLLGVSIINRKNKYYATCKERGQKISLGVFYEEVDAHRAWQLKKYEILCNHAKFDGFPTKLKDAILNRAEMILSDFQNYRVTEAV